MPMELDREAVRTFVIFRHSSLSPRRDVPPRADPQRVARLATQLANRVLGGVCDGDQCKVVECAGLLVYAMDGYGLNYEEVCQLACQKVAEILRQITADPRQTDPQRNQQLRSQIVQADALTLTVKLAEILAVLETLPAVYDAEKLAARALDLKNWVDRTGHILEAMAAYRGQPRMQAALAKARAGLEKVGQLAAGTRARLRAYRVEVARGGILISPEPPARPESYRARA